MNMTCNSTRNPAAQQSIVTLALIVLLLPFTEARAQVTYFERPPTAAELRRALTGPSSASSAAPGPARTTVTGTDVAPTTLDRPTGVRTRVIVWTNDGKPVATGAQSQAGQASAVAPINAPITNAPGPSAYAQAYAERGSGPAAGMPINFASGSSHIDPASTGFVRTVAEMLASDVSLQLVIEGHTNSSGSYERNMVLSWERAMAVFRLLVEQYGIDPARMQLLGKGPTEPMPGTSPADGTNRRVQFRLQG